jgi:choline dehydrogenase-like flavoprotein
VSQDYDVAIVGAGFAGALLAKRLTQGGCRVLVIEAGNATGLTPADYQSNVDYFHANSAKTPNSPYPDNKYSPAPSVLTLKQIDDDEPDTGGYMVQNGPLPFSSNYQRERSGTSLHWLGMSFRMVPADFEMKSRYGVGVDWAIPYEEMNDDYEAAEFETGVAAEVEDQTFCGITFRDGYVFPMHRIPPSFQDKWFAERIDNTTVTLAGDELELKVLPLAHSRNSMPNAAYDGGAGYTPVGAPGQPGVGERCEGNASCTPICPVQAKWNAGKTWASIPEDDFDIRTQSVVTNVNLSTDRRTVTGLEVTPYDPSNALAPTGPTEVVTADVYVVAAHAIETAKLLLMSDAANSSDQVGRNLMDHPYLLTWGLAPDNLGSYRGPGLTSGIPWLRDGDFRSKRAAWRTDLTNWGWTFSAFSPGSDVEAKVHGDGLYGAALRESLADELPRQTRFGFLVEQLPDPNNRVSIDRRHVDALGVPRPVINYDVDSYSRAGMVAARQFTRQVYERCGIQEFTAYHASDSGYMTYQHEQLSFHGAGHIVGTHRLGDDPNTSVTDTDLRCWDHENLFLVGCGSMPTIGTSNPSLTMAALVYRAARAILKDLGK